MLRIKILHRYIIGEVFRAFFLALVTITCVFVLMMVMATASRVGLAPSDILRLVPFLIPGSLPFTVPVSLLFAVTVVYGRLASDNEIIAAKGAGLSVWTLLWPTILMALILSIILTYASAEAIPNANFAAKKVMFDNMEELFYKTLAKDLVFDTPKWPFLVKVKGVRDKVMLGPTFKHRNPKAAKIPHDSRGADPNDPGEFDMIIQAREARLTFGTNTNDEGKTEPVVRIHFVEMALANSGPLPPKVALNGTTVEMPISTFGDLGNNKAIEEMTIPAMREAEEANHELILHERQRQAIAAAMWFGSGRPQFVKWEDFQMAFRKQDYWQMEVNKYQTETQMRLAMAWGSLFFVVIGAPVGILFARRDFLSAFISCFMPIIIVYYPMMLFGVNMGKEGIINPIIALWSGNLVLWLGACFWALPPVLKH